MFDIGFWEMLVIGVMALVVLGPERLPGAIRSLISGIRSVKELANGFKQEVASHLDAHELHTNLKKAESLGMESLGKDLQKSVNELKQAAASVRKPYKNKTMQSSQQLTQSQRGNKEQDTGSQQDADAHQDTDAQHVTANQNSSVEPSVVDSKSNNTNDASLIDTNDSSITPNAPSKASKASENLVTKPFDKTDE
jgi:sec-independent protein translocase protein TatB